MSYKSTGGSIEELMTQSYSPPPTPWATTPTISSDVKTAAVGIGMFAVAGLVLTGLLGYWLIKKL